MVAMSEKEILKEDWPLAAWNITYVNCGATAHIVKYDSIISEDKALVSPSIETADVKNAWVIIPDKSKARHSNENEMVKLNLVSHGRSGNQNLIFVSSLCNDGHT